MLFQSYHLAIETTHSFAEILQGFTCEWKFCSFWKFAISTGQSSSCSRGLVCRQPPTLDWYRVEEHSWVILQQNKVHRIHCGVHNVFSLISLKETQCPLSIKLLLFQIHSYAAYNLVTQINMVFEEGNYIEQEHITICSCLQSSSKLSCF
jgi:hypothetical protein